MLQQFHASCRRLAPACLKWSSDIEMLDSGPDNIIPVDKWRNATSITALTDDALLSRADYVDSPPDDNLCLTWKFIAHLWATFSTVSAEPS
jgi:hypothetical protein